MNYKRGAITYYITHQQEFKDNVKNNANAIKEDIKNIFDKSINNAK